MREITEKKLKRILKSHKDWVNSKGKRGYRADLVETILIGVDLRGADLRGADLREANLSWINLTDTDLRGADLRNADLSDTEVRGVDLNEVNLSDAHLRGADLREANLTKAVLTGADLREADLRGAELSDSVLRGTNLNDAKFFYTDHSGTNRIGTDLSVALRDQTKLCEEEQLKVRIKQKQIEIEKKEMEIELLKSEVLKKKSEKIKECCDTGFPIADMNTPHKEEEALAQISQAEGLDRYVWTLEEQKNDITNRSLQAYYNKAVLLFKEEGIPTKKRVEKTLAKVLVLIMKKAIQVYQSIFDKPDNFSQEDTPWEAGQVFNCQLNAFDKYNGSSSFCSRPNFNSIHTTLPP